MVNFLALLGWSPGGDREVFSRDELVQAFTLEGIGGGNAVFDQDKLDWFNGQQIGRMPAETVADAIQPLLEAAGWWRDSYAAGGDQRAWLGQVIELLKSRVRFLAEFVEYGRPFLAGTVAYEPEAVQKRLLIEGLDGHVTALRDAYAALGEDRFEAGSLETALRAVADARGIKAGVLIHATRVAMAGRTVSPGLFEMVELIGRERTIGRLQQLEGFLAERATRESRGSVARNLAPRKKSKKRGPRALAEGQSREGQSGGLHPSPAQYPHAAHTPVPPPRSATPGSCARRGAPCTPCRTSRGVRRCTRSK